MNEPIAAGATLGGSRRPWRRALAWLLLLGPFFFLSYGFANWLSSQRAEVGAIVFPWERQIPFIAWTIVPYWLIDLFYGLSLFLCLTRRQLDTHAARLLMTQVLAVTSFIVFPLRCTFERGEVAGGFGWLFATLGRFDQPFNQAPSLHIALLVVLLEPYLRVLPRRWHPLVWLMALLIGVSVLTTWQHHFFDIPTGLWLGGFVIWLLPSEGLSPLRRVNLPPARQRLRLAGAYAVGALIGMAAGIGGGGAWLWLLWPAAALGLVASIYALFDATAFGKRADGTMPPAVRVLLAPYQLGAWLNSRWWTRRLTPANSVMDGVLLGRLPTPDELSRHQATALVDLCAELPGPRGTWKRSVVPMLDLLPPTPEQLTQAVAAIEQLRQTGTVWVCCALGMSRSALAVAAWLLHSGRADGVERAIALVRAARPAVVIDQTAVDALRQWWQGGHR
ncbi:MAG: phosphatase PAP2/dual specificity phosphatase family protein [Candidatus Accumulibacter sp.]|nr:phosphatase PAP2/dual specificity phosphatase family protein [Accumulibacter sp.]